MLVESVNEPCRKYRGGDYCSVTRNLLGRGSSFQPRLKVISSFIFEWTEGLIWRIIFKQTTENCLNHFSLDFPAPSWL